MKRVLLAGILAMLSPQVFSQNAPVGCSWESVGQKHGVNPYLLYAIAKTESNLKPSAINKNRNGSLDLCMMQINTFWLPTLAQYGISAADLMGNSCTCLEAGAWVLAKCQKRLGITWKAVGCYNPGDSSYPLKVYRNLPKEAFNDH